jgi:pSer/pThr/pTyr-binding forkhead associated (FHA) protein
MANKKFTLKKLPNGAEIPLTAELSVGRSPESGLRLVEGSPSRRHALLSISADSAWVEDLGSTNGTFVNDKRIDAKVKLNSNDRLRFDVEEYLFRIESDEPQADQTIARPAAADVVADSGRVKVPSGWVDNPQHAAANKTLYMTPEQLQQERKRILASGAVDAAFGQVEAPQLIVLGGAGESLRIRLRAADSGKKEWSVGGEGEREILLKRVGVSALHAKIVNDGNRWKVIDQLSANGTFVNGKRCTMSFLNSGDRISFGSVECIFQLPGGGAANTGAATNSGTDGSRLKKILLITAASFLATLAVLYVLLKKLN